MKFTHSCGATWSGLKVEHCASCHETFSGTEAGDKHRVGKHGVTEGKNRRRCLTVDEMKAVKDKKGNLWFDWMINKHGTRVWSRHRPNRPPRTFSEAGQDGTDVAMALPSIDLLRHVRLPL